MTRRLYFLGQWCARHGLLVLLLWIGALLVLNVANNRLPPPVPEAFVLEGTNSAKAQTLLNRAFPGASAQAAPLVVFSEEGLDDSTSEQLLEDIAASVLVVDQVNAVVTPADDPSLLSEDGRTALINITVDERASGAQDLGIAVQEAAEEAAGGKVEVALGGYLGQSISQVETTRSEAIGLLAAVIILLVTLRRGWPVIIPFTTAIMSVGCGLAIVGLLERVTYVPGEAAILGTMLGLGVGIDYALFLVTKHRTLLLKGYEVMDSTGRTGGTAGAGMVFAGGTLVAAVSGLALTGISFLAWLGFAAAIIVSIAVWAALTLVPALFGLMGNRVLPRKWKDAELRHDDTELDRGIWARIADSVTGRPWPYAIGATALLLLMAAPLLSMTFGQTDGTSLPDDSPGARSTVLIAEGFGPGSNGPMVVVGELYSVAAAPDDVEPGAARDPRTLDPRLVGVTGDLAEQPGVESVSDPVVSTDGGVALWVLTPTTGPADPATEELVTLMREEILPAATEGRAMTAYLGGVTAAVTDLNQRVADRLVPFIVGVVMLSFFLLMIAYRSVVIPAKAAAMNLLSIAAAYGVVVAVFQWGWGAPLIGLDGPVPIQSFVPMMMFAVLFGLSMDYEVFLLTSLTEHWERSQDMKIAVRRALADTGQVITSAAAIMVVIFGSFILTESDVTKMFGVGLATAVLVDATIVRCVLVPALMVLLARSTWWLPRWLDRLLPHLRVEGDPAALESIHREPPGVVHDPAKPAVGLTAAVVGAGAAWWLGNAAADGGLVAYLGLAIAVSAVIGALVAWLPRGMPGAGSRLGIRAVALVGGMAIAATVFGIWNAFVPEVDLQPGVAAAWALLATVLVTAFTPLKRYGVAAILGAVVMAVNLPVAAGAESQAGGLLRNAILPALVAFVAALLVDRIVRALSATRFEPSSEPAASDPDHSRPREPARQEVGA